MDRKIKVIIADDIQKIAEMNRNIAISNKNIEVIGMAYNGKEELDMILELKPDLVITDNKMPEMNGVDVIEKINNLEIENKPDFILVTGEYSFELNNKCNELGVFKVISKLSVRENLPYTIEEYVEQQNTNKKVEEHIVFENDVKEQVGIFKKILEKLKKEV